MPTLLLLGAHSDIARALAHRFGRAGYGLVLAARHAARLAPDASDLRLRYGVEVHVVEFDALDSAGHAAWYAALPVRPEVVCCVFGYLGDQARGQAQWPEAQQILWVNYVGAVSVLECAARDLEARGQGAVVGISSVAGDRGRGSNYLYGSAKAGLTAYLSGLRNRLAKAGVQVLTVKPGFVATAMTEGLNTPGLLTAQPAEVAEDVFRALMRRKDVIYTRWYWRYIMLIIKLIPEGVFKKLSL